jgi:hypothetical protein
MGDRAMSDSRRHLNRQETSGGDMLLLVLLGWFFLSIPIALVVGAVIRRGQRPIPPHRIELSPEEPAAIPVGTRS